MSERKANNPKQQQGKILAVAYVAVAAFTAISIIVPILWERMSRR
jgi:hypothetical protein